MNLWNKGLSVILIYELVFNSFMKSSYKVVSMLSLLLFFSIFASLPFSSAAASGHSSLASLGFFDFVKKFFGLSSDSQEIQQSPARSGTRAISTTTYTPSTPISVNITITFQDNDCGAAIVEYVPAGWSVSDIAGPGSGVWNTGDNAIRWAPIDNIFCSGSSDTYVLSYTATPNASQTTSVQFSGIYSIDGSNDPITGNNVVNPVVTTQSVTCGDSVCSSSESCNSCESDCGRCTTSSSGSGSSTPTVPPRTTPTQPSTTVTQPTTNTEAPSTTSTETPETVSTTSSSETVDGSSTNSESSKFVFTILVIVLLIGAAFIGYTIIHTLQHK